ncbi:MAG: hypothetical protein A2283_03080 [Lentisphaerae bacterium RIFOXYA12_FULL_48_11]|nr:MAG: hypothetical protein A2283_03080 [Lentisphaerae bacterium RIFOXYA12_FULL_48_11]
MKKGGFTATEILMATTIMTMVIAGSLSVFIAANRSWFSGDVQMRCAREVDMVLQKMTYGAVGSNGLRTAIFTNVAVAVTGAQWSVTYDTPDGGKYKFAFDPAMHVIQYYDLLLSNGAVTIGVNITTSTVTVVTNGLNIMVQVAVNDGRFGATNEMATYIRYRN